MKRRTLILILLLVAINLIKIYRLNVPNFPYFDEKNFFIPAAKSLLENHTDPETTLPIFGKTILSLGIFILGDNPYGWRLFPLIFSLISIIFIFLLAKKLFKSDSVAFISGLFLTLETSWFLHSRTAMLEIFLATFVLSGFYFVWTFIEKNKFSNLFASAISFGLAFSIKWSALIPTFLAISLIFLFQNTNYKNKLASGIVLLIIPLFLYFCSYASVIDRYGLNKFLTKQKDMFLFHTIWLPKNFENVGPKYLPNFEYTRKILKNPSSWILDKPMVYLENSQGQKTKAIIFLFNPLIFWPGLVLIIYSTYKGFKTKNKKFIFLSAIFFSSYLPWIFSPRISIPYYLLYGIGALVINLAYFTNITLKKFPFLAYLYFLSVTITFILFYPLISFLEVSKDYLYKITWLWQLPIK